MQKSPSKFATGELLIYIDPGFLEDVGHYRNFALSIHAEAKKRHIDVRHFVNNNVGDQAIKLYGLERIFNYKAILNDIYGNGADYTKWLKNVSQRLQQRKGKLSNRAVLNSFSKNLKDILAGIGSTDYRKIVLYMYTSHPLYIPIYATRINAPEFTGLDITAHLDLFYLNQDFCRGVKTPAYEKMLKKVSEELEKYDLSKKVNLYSDSTRVIKSYQPYFKRQIKQIPIPLTDGIVKPVAGATPNKDTVTLGFFGYAHKKQGYHLVKSLYDRLIKMHKFGNVNFIIRHNVKFVDNKMCSLVSDFQRQVERVVHLNGALGNNVYHRWLSKCDIILIPHSKEYYPCQTSGTLVDAFALDKLVVVPKETWLADEVNRYRAGVTFHSDNPESFIKAVEDLLTNFDSYKLNCWDLEGFVSYHSASNLFERINLND